MADKSSNKAYDTLQTLAALASNMALTPFAGISGLSGSIHGQEAGNRAIDNVMSLAYEPSREGSHQQLQSLAEMAGYLELPSQWLGDKAMNLTNLPAAGTAAYMLPELLTSLVPAKHGGTAIRAGARNLSGGPSTPITRQRGSIGIMKDSGDDKVVFSGTMGEPATEILPYGAYQRADGSIAMGENRFGGIFGSFDKDVAQSHGPALQVMSVKNHIDHDDFVSLVYEGGKEIRDKLRDILKEHKNSGPIKDRELDEIMEYILEEKSVHEIEFGFDGISGGPEMGLGRFDEILGQDIKSVDLTDMTQLGEASWDLQGLKGELARRLGFDSIGMPDEHGESVLVLRARDINTEE